jgi:DNA-binding response OmpR family regulator
VSHRILLATSSATLHCTLCQELRADGHFVQRASTRQHAAALLAGQALDVLLLAPLEQPTDALELLRELRAGRLPGHARADLPVLTLGASSRELDTLRAYAAGSDHHVPAETSYLLLAAAINAVLRRNTATPARRRVGAIEIDPDTRQVRVRGELVELTSTEYRLLRALAAHPTRVFTKHELLRDVWGFQAAGRTRTVDSHAVRLRQKLAAHGHAAVQNVWGVGYRLTDAA